MSEPAGSDQLDLNPDIVENIRDMVLTPVTTRKIFLLLTRTHYSSADNYGQFSEKLKHFIWDDSPKPKLFIDLDYLYNPKQNDQRPAIFVGCSDFLYAQTVMDAEVRKTNDLSGEEFYNQAQTQVVVRHVGKTPDEALQLGDLSAQFFRGLRKVMKHDVGLTRYVVSRLASSKPFDKKPEQADQQFVSDLVIDLAFNCNWMIWTESHRLKVATFSNLVKLAGRSDVDWTSTKTTSPE